MSATALATDLSEPLIPLREVPKLKWLPRRRGGARLAHATLYRWATKGVSGVFLPVLRVGGQPCVTASGLRQFFADVAAAQRGSPPVIQSRTPSRRAREIAASQKRLAQAGI